MSLGETAAVSKRGIEMRLNAVGLLPFGVAVMSVAPRVKFKKDCVLVSSLWHSRLKLPAVIVA